MGYDGDVKIVDNVSSLHIYGVREWHTDLLKNWNIIPCKTAILKPPMQLSHKAHILSYIRGYIDGDGCICYGKNRNTKIIRFSVCGTLDMMYWIKSVLGVDNKIMLNGISKVNYSYRIGGKTAITALSEVLNVNVPYTMNRKWGKLQ